MCFPLPNRRLPGVPSNALIAVSPRIIFAGSSDIHQRCYKIILSASIQHDVVVDTVIVTRNRSRTRQRKWRKRSSFSTRCPILSHRSFRMTRGAAGRGGRGKSHATIILLAARDSDLLSTIREQKHLLHHRSYRRYRHRPQSAPRVLAPG